jgi:hypothetical protein
MIKRGNNWKWAMMFVLTLFFTLPTIAEEKEKALAFPGAEGFGRYVTGGRGGKVYYVTNLNDSGSGSLRWALSQKGAKIIMFKVSGTIHLKSSLSIPSNTTVSGQSAPGDGICVADYPVNVSGNNVIVRYMRFRLGNTNVKVDGADGWDGFGGMDGQDMMIDHCSISWSIDECCSFLGNKNTTVQWCIVAQSLVNAGHSKGAHGYGGNWGGSGASFHHNLIAHHTSRTPRLGPRPTTQMDERMDMRNNVIYNYGSNGCYGGEGMNVNIVNNYYKPGPGSPTGNKGKRIAGIGIRTTSYINTYPAYKPAWHIWGKFFVDGNYNSKYPEVFRDNWTNGIYNQISSSDNDGTYTETTRDTMKLDSPIPFVLTTTHSAEDAYERVLDYAGASLHRDTFDEMIVSDTRNGVASHTGNGLGKGFINSQEDNRPADAGSDWSAWPTLNSTNAPTDSDGDGMPDTYEDINNLDSTNASDGAQMADNGYTNVENYLNGLVSNITSKQVEGGTPMGDIQTIEEGGVEVMYELQQTTSNGDWTFNNGFSISSSKGYAEGKNLGIKYSRNTVYTINIPDGISIAKVGFAGYSNVDGETAYLGELNGNTFGETDYVFPSRSDNTEAEHTITLYTPATKKITFTPRGQQVVWRIYLYTTATSDVKQVISVPSDKESIYDLQGRKVMGIPTKGIYIINGKKEVRK